MASAALAEVRLFDSNALLSDSATIWWLDDHRLFFLGQDQGKNKTAKTWKVEDYQFLVLDLQKNKISPVNRQMTDLLCAEAGKVAFFALDPASNQGDWVLHIGVFGAEKATRVTRKDLSVRRAWLNAVSCRLHRSEPPWVRFANETGLDALPLKEEHGFLYVGPGGIVSGHKQTDYEIVLRSPDGRQTVVAQHNNPNGRHLKASYVPFLRQYVINGTRSNLDKDIAPGWLMTPGGKAEEIALHRPPVPSIYLYRPTRIGVWISASDPMRATDDSAQGAWVIQDSFAKRIVSGVVRQEAVSPNGCKIAFSHASSWKAHYDGIRNLREGGIGYTTLKVANVCDEGTNK